jgi:Arc/MetJ-type ribon-helix-helix transcriptional regulator
MRLGEKNGLDTQSAVIREALFYWEEGMNTKAALEQAQREEKRRAKEFAKK